MSQATPSLLRSLVSIGVHAFGLFLLPFAVGLAAGSLVDVSEVLDTAHVMTVLAVVFILPPFLAQLAGILLKVRREYVFLSARGLVDPATLLASVRRHVAIVTPRGWAVLLTGLWFVVLSLTFQWASLGLVAVISLLLFYVVLGASSFVSTFLVRTFAAGLGRGVAGVRRELSPAVVTSGEPAEERFHLTAVPVPAGFVLLIEDANPPELATESRYAVGPGARRGSVTVSGRFRRTPRGLHRLGPASIWYQDALGFTRVSVASLATAELKVLPRFHPLEIVSPPRSPLDAPDLLTRPHRFATEDHFRFKEYTNGDDTRRIQWRLSMRAGRLMVRQPESREISTQRVVLVLDTWLPPGALLEDALGISAVLDRLIETWISLAQELVERGDKVLLVAVADDGRGQLQVEKVAGDRGARRRWQDLGARARWQGAMDVPAVLEPLETEGRAVVVSSRFHAPPAPAPGQEPTWIYLSPLEALGEDPPFWEQLVGPGPGAGGRLFGRLVRLPGPAGSDEAGSLREWRDVAHQRSIWSARQRLRRIAKIEGTRVQSALIAQGCTLYRLEPGPLSHRLVGVATGRKAAA